MAVKHCVGCGVPFVPASSETICALCIAEVRAGDRRTDLTNTLVQTSSLPPPPVIIDTPRRRASSGRLRPVEPEPLEEADEADVMVECPMCAEEIKARAKLCKHCGSDVKKGTLRIRRRGDVVFVNTTHVSPGLAALLSFLIPGMGQIYAGATGRGIFFLFGTIFGGFFLVLPGLLVWFVSIFDASQCASDANRNAMGSRRR